MNKDELMLTSLLDCERIDLADPKELTDEQRARYDQMRERLMQGESVQYILGATNFMGIDLYVDKRTLIPRPETEILVELAIEKTVALQSKNVCRVLDLGVGSGNISIALAKNISNAIVTAIDISEDALTLAAKNAKASGVESKIQFLYKDMSAYLNAAAGEDEKFDIIISNPPYIPTEQLMQLPMDVQQEPRLALDGGADGLDFYRDIIAHSHRLLTSGSFLFMEIGDGQRLGIEMLFGCYPQYENVEFFKDYVGTDRIVMAQLA